MTEAAPGTLFLDAEHAVSKAGSAGVPHFFSDVRVVRPDFTPVEVGETGEVVVRGPHVMPGYWGLPDETAAVFADGWFRSGDAARIDEDGYVFIVDRIKDMIISGGENIYPAEIEDLLLAHPDIVECAVIGVADDKWGEVPRAVVVAREGVELDPDDVLALTRRAARQVQDPEVGGRRGRAPAHRLREAPQGPCPLAVRHQLLDRERHMTITVNGLDELKKLAGSDLGTSEWIEITQERIDTFADATGDHQWIHVDPARAAAGPFGAPIAHGYLTLSLFIPLFTELLDVEGVSTKVNYGLNKVRFPSPVKVGSRIRLVARLASVEDVPGGVQIAVDGTLEIDGGQKPAAVLQSLSRFYA